jgi:hypothetical protein
MNKQLFPGLNQHPNDLYQDYYKYRNMVTTPVTQYRTVFNDITDEWNNCSEEERKFIESDEEYQASNVLYAQQFNAFLIDQFGLQFANSKYGTSAEKVLVAIRNARGRFHSSAMEDMAKIRNENAMLQQQLKELEELVNAK